MIFRICSVFSIDILSKIYYDNANNIVHGGLTHEKSIIYRWYRHHQHGYC